MFKKLYKYANAYKKLDERLRETYGDYDNLLEMVVDDLCCYHFTGEMHKSLLLRGADAYEWEAYKELNMSIDEIKKAISFAKEAQKQTEYM